MSDLPESSTGCHYDHPVVFVIRGSYDHWQPLIQQRATGNDLVEVVATERARRVVMVAASLKARIEADANASVEFHWKEESDVKWVFHIRGREGEK